MRLRSAISFSFDSRSLSFFVASCFRNSAFHPIFFVSSCVLAMESFTLLYCACLAFKTESRLFLYAVDNRCLNSAFFLFYSSSSYATVIFCSSVFTKRASRDWRAASMARIWRRACWRRYCTRSAWRYRKSALFSASLIGSCGEYFVRLRLLVDTPWSSFLLTE